jgi:hypothetical protein
VLVPIDAKPIPVLHKPVVLASSVLPPIAVFLLPVVLAQSEENPIAVLLEAVVLLLFHDSYHPCFHSHQI